MSGASKYEARVVALRKGDWVSATSAQTGRPIKHRLGKFLGAGNATHVYELADEPGKVIRIPFIAQHLIPAGEAAGAVKSARHYTKQTVAQAPWHEGLSLSKVASVVDWGKGHEFIISKLVNITEDGTQFLDRIADIKKLNPADQRRLEGLYDAIDEAVVRRGFGDSGRYTGVAPIHHKANTATKLKTKGRTALAEAEDVGSEARQFGWDGRHWVLLDWE